MCIERVRPRLRLRLARRREYRNVMGWAIAGGTHAEHVPRGEITRVDPAGSGGIRSIDASPRDRWARRRRLGETLASISTQQSPDDGGLNLKSKTARSGRSGGEELSRHSHISHVTRKPWR
ncbi:unnamed protein product, partial [Iphiclides podalirius]